MNEKILNILFPVIGFTLIIIAILLPSIIGIVGSIIAVPFGIAVILLSTWWDDNRGFKHEMTIYVLILPSVILSCWCIVYILLWSANELGLMKVINL